MNNRRFRWSNYSLMSCLNHLSILHMCGFQGCCHLHQRFIYTWRIRKAISLLKELELDYFSHQRTPQLLITCFLSLRKTSILDCRISGPESFRFSINEKRNMDLTNQYEMNYNHPKQVFETGIIQQFLLSAFICIRRYITENKFH